MTKITVDALIARINRHLSEECLKLRIARDHEVDRRGGLFYVTDQAGRWQGAIGALRELEAYARDLGALEAHEAVAA